MKKYNILVTGVGAIIGSGIAQSLRLSGRELNIIGMDIYEDAAGRCFCDGFIQALRSDSPDYCNFLIEVIQREKIDLVFFGLEHEIYRVSDSRGVFGEYLERLVLTNPETIELSRDKFQTYSFFAGQGVDVIPTRIDGDYEELAAALGSPFLLKYRHSSSSKGMTRICDRADFDYWKRKSGDEFMVQEIVGDDAHEYTVGVFGFGDGSCLKPFVLRRKLSGEGATAKAVTEENPELCAESEKLCRLLKVLGPVNFQFRLHHGKYLLLEINPRISAATSIRAAFGYNEPLLCLEYFVEHRNPVDPETLQGRASRYVADWVVYAGADR